MSMGRLSILNLENNDISVSETTNSVERSLLSDLTEIQVLDLSGNGISGRIPGCFNNFTSLVQPDRTTETLKLAPGFVFTDASRFDISFYIENALVHWKGLEREYNRTLRLLKLIDLSNNRFVGNIPKEFSLLRGLVSLNLSRNHLTGDIDSGIGQMEMLESLDLSKNQLSGEIPIGMAGLNYLSVLDLSNNNLSGSIPSGTQLRGFNASAYAGNNELCGPPPAACLAPDHGPPNDHVGKEDSIFGLGFYISVVLGFVVGFWGVIVILVVNKTWRIAYFGFWNKIYDWLYVTITIIYLRRSR
ncbi:UNVERIFIED_CONTAM: Receptor-like protein EIX2 [Sesamum latifolium]|uniref:Receptor-like protein EIX2 n=1 Tax=Sesamum latifolium TaxID=2727402 RepID=A0AAW2WCZ5_9LAMI